MSEANEQASAGQTVAEPVMVRIPEHELKFLQKNFQNIKAAAESLYLSLDCHIQDHPDELLSNRVVNSFNRLRDAIASEKATQP